MIIYSLIRCALARILIVVVLSVILPLLKRVSAILFIIFVTLARSIVSWRHARSFADGRSITACHGLHFVTHELDVAILLQDLVL